MDKLLNDIIKYKRGELNPTEMHALERKALSDPFLAEALEGAENISPEDLAQDVAEINKKILKKKSTWFTPLRIAAGVLLILSSGYLFYQLTPNRETLALKTDKKNPVPSLPKVSDSTENLKKPQTKETETINERREVAKKIEPRKKKTAKESDIALSQPKIENHSEQTKALSNADSKIESEELKNDQASLSTPVAVKPIENLLEDMKKEAKPTIKMNRALSKSEAPSGAGIASRAHAKMKTISGKVVSAEDGSPLPGVNVVIDGTVQGTITDGSGYFNIQASDDQGKLVFSFIGMQTKEVDTQGKDKLDVAMNTDVTHLSEVVVTEMTFANEDAEPVIRLAYPQGGEKAYNRYLETNVRYPEDALKNNVKGKVKIEFIVHPDGSFDQFKVVKRIGYGCEEELIRLIKEGAKWFPTTENGKPVESHVRVGLKFDPAKAGR